MLSVVRRIIRLSGNDSWKIKIAVVFSFFEGLFAAAPIGLIYYAIMKILDNSITASDAVLIGVLLFAFTLLRALFKFLIDISQGDTAYKLFARERLKLGEHLKRLPMGYFSEGNIGNITSVITTDIVFVEQWGMHAVATVVSSYISIGINILFMLFIDYRISVSLIIIFLLSSLSLKTFNDASKVTSQQRQGGFGVLTKAIIEFVKGISVIKAFNVQNNKESDIEESFESFKDMSIAIEKGIARLYARYNYWFALGVAIIIGVTVYALHNGQIDVSWGLLLLLFSLQLFIGFKALGGVANLIRVMEAGLNRYDSIMNLKEIDEHGKDINLTHYDIEFKNVGFAYEHEQVLENVSFKIPEKSMTALVGKSGCGKTTVTNLIARFWDVQEGQVLIGGVDVKDMTVDSLHKNISMVFQKVYLFNDSIIENIRFGNPDATMDEIIEVCKRARCHDFIMNMEKGYDTMVEEGGASLSGGEKQRISIARAMLKDAPIILLDEATANIDPDNERIIQEAINELVKEKTLVLIAHKLSTIRAADQILVMEEGRIVQKGNHKELTNTDGIYLDFWTRRKKATGWKISQ